MESSKELIPLFWLGTVLMLFLAIGLLFLVVTYQKYFTKMKKKEAEILLKTAISSERNERKRIAQELHDGLQSDLSAQRIFTLLLEKKITEPESKKIVDYLKSSIEQTIENTRIITYKLMPPLLESAGFNLALQEYFQQLQLLTNKKFELKGDITTPIIHGEYSYDLFRIVQEFTQNMLKHNNISNCIVCVIKNDTECKLEIIDDGKSFNFKELREKSNRLGLLSIQSRIQAMSAVIEQRTVKSGNHFVIYLPHYHD
jgi:signal transduction histidine kinase